MMGEAGPIVVETAIQDIMGYFTTIFVPHKLLFLFGHSASAPIPM
jgi:hypothetical protein